MQLATALADVRGGAAVAVALALTTQQLPARPQRKGGHSVYVLSGHELAAADVEAPQPPRRRPEDTAAVVVVRTASWRAAVPI